MEDWTQEELRNFRGFFQGKLGGELLKEIERMRNMADSVEGAASRASQGLTLGESVSESLGAVKAYQNVVSVINKLSGE